jgi:hypothetical protein
VAACALVGGYLALVADLDGCVPDAHALHVKLVAEAELRQASARAGSPRYYSAAMLNGGRAFFASDVMHRLQRKTLLLITMSG